MKKTFKTIVTGALISSIIACGACGSEIRNNALSEGKVEKISTEPSEVKVVEVPASSVHTFSSSESDEPKESFLIIPETQEVKGTTESHFDEDGILQVDKIFLENPMRIEEERNSVANEKDAIFTDASSEDEEEEEVVVTEEDTDEVEVIKENLIPTEKQLIATFSTTFSMEEELLNRVYNLNLACKESSVIIPAGEDFNWHVIVGNTNYADGYKLANMYSGGKLVQGYGGGVCQVSTTIYGCVRELGLPVTELHHHGLPVDYVDWDAKEDAAVDDIGGFNFIFTNNLGYDIEINAYTSEIPENELNERGLLTVEFYRVS